MNLFNKAIEIENKDFNLLSEEELLVLNYWNTYREANLYYNLMMSAYSPELAVTYATKGKLAASKAVTFENKLNLQNAPTATILMGNFGKTPSPKVDAKLKLLDKLLLTGQITKTVYNQKCREVMLNKPKSA